MLIPHVFYLLDLVKEDGSDTTLSAYFITKCTPQSLMKTHDWFTHNSDAIANNVNAKFLRRKYSQGVTNALNTAAREEAEIISEHIGKTVAVVAQNLLLKDRIMDSDDSIAAFTCIVRDQSRVDQVGVLMVASATPQTKDDVITAFGHYRDAITSELAIYPVEDIRYGQYNRSIAQKISSITGFKTLVFTSDYIKAEVLSIQKKNLDSLPSGEDNP